MAGLRRMVRVCGLLIALRALPAVAYDPYGVESSAAPRDSSLREAGASRDSAPHGDSLAAVEPNTAAASPAPAVAPADTGGIELEEKTVKGRATSTHREKEVSRIRLGREQLQKVAAAQGDPFKALGTLPGVSNQNDISVRPFVRGGKAEETQVLWEGIPLLHPYHFASIYSIFNMEALEDMTLYSGGFPATVGNALSGAILMRSRPAPLDSFRLFADLSVLRGLGHVGVPLVKNHLGASYAYQAFWYDVAVERGWDLVDLLAGDSALSAQKQQFKQYLDLPNFKDHQFGLDWKGGDALSARYTGILSEDVFTVRNTRDRYYVNRREVPEYEYQRALLFPEGVASREKLRSWDSLAIVSVDNFVHGLSFAWQPSDRWRVDQSAAWQAQDWHVSFFDQEIWTDSSDADGRYAGYRRPGPSAMLFNLANEAVDYRADARYSGEEHVLGLGASLSVRSAAYETRMAKPVYDLIVNGSVDAIDALGFFNPGGIAFTTDQPFVDSSTNYLEQLPDIIRFDHAGRQSGSFLGAYVTDEWSLDSRHRLTLGLRAEADSYGRDLFLSPRVAWFQALGSKDELTLASGFYSQADFPFFVRATSPGLRSEKAFHANAEWTHAFSPAYRLECQVYQKNYFDLVTPELVNTGRLDWGEGVLANVDSADFETLTPEEKQIVIDNFGERRLAYRSGGRGKAAGAEVSFFYNPNKVWNGWLSGEAGYSKRQDRPGERVYDFRQSRPWAFNWVNYFHMPSNYELSLRARYASGLPFTDFDGVSLGGSSPGGAITSGKVSGDTVFQIGPRNAARYAPYSRWDIRLSKEFKLGRHPMQTYFEIWNAFNTPNFIMSDVRTRDWRFVDLNYPFPILFLGLNYRW